MTWIPDIISFIKRILSSVLKAVLKRNIEIRFPKYTVNKNDNAC